MQADFGKRCAPRGWSPRYKGAVRLQTFESQRGAMDAAYTVPFSGSFRDPSDAVAGLEFVGCHALSLRAFLLLGRQLSGRRSETGRGRGVI